MTPKEEDEKSEDEGKPEKMTKAKKKAARKAKSAARKDIRDAEVTAKKKVRKTKDIGVDVKPPERTCTDEHCPFHGTLPVRGLTIKCEVVASRMQNGAIVKRERLKYVPKYERYEKVTSRYAVHNPPCIGAKRGDKVTIMECRPLSKTVSFVIIEKQEGT